MLRNPEASKHRGVAESIASAILVKRMEEAPEATSRVPLNCFAVTFGQDAAALLGLSSTIGISR